jgi:2-dehydropantoate 2-reductase
VHIVVMGAGGTGGYFGAKFQRAGEDVTFIARGGHLAAIRAGGLRIRSEIDGEWTVEARAVEDAHRLEPADIVLFCVKSYDTEAAAEVVRPVVGEQTGVLTIQNGVDNVDKLGARLGPGHVVAGTAHVFSTIEAPGVIHHVLLGRLTVGELDGAETPRIRGFGAACERAEIPCAITPRITGALWEKYVFLAAHAGMTALTRCPTGVIRAVPETRRMYRQLVEELAALARAEGAGLSGDAVDHVMATLDGLGPNGYSSLHHDLICGKRLELEALHGHAVRLGELHGVPTPMLSAVYAALRPHRDGAGA